MAETGAVGKAHRLDDVPAVDHGIGDGHSVVRPGEFQDQGRAISALLSYQVCRRYSLSKFDNIID